MAQKYLDAEGLKQVKNHYDSELGKKVNVEAGKSLVSDEEISKLLTVKENANPNTIEGIQINGTDLVPDGETKKVNIKPEDLTADLADYVKDSELTEQLGSYLKSEDASTTYVKEEGFNDKVKGVVGSVYRPKGSLANFEAIKAVESPTEGDVYNATDSGANYVYVGEGQGDDESGWDKLSETVVLDGYLETATAEQTYAKQTDLPTALTTEDINQALGITE